MLSFINKNKTKMKIKMEKTNVRMVQGNWCAFEGKSASQSKL